MIDLNCDMGELEDGAHEAALMESITSASVACGEHAGDEEIMRRTVRLGVQRGVRIGAHPSYPDRANFGRTEMAISGAELETVLTRQIERLERVALAEGACVAYVKPHGALYNVAARNADTAAAIGRAVAGWRTGAAILGLAGSAALDMWRAMGLEAIAEGFADRRYEPYGSLRSRKRPDALILDPQEAAAQALRLAREARVGSICIHGDTPGAIAIARACRAALDAAAQPPTGRV